MIVNPPSDSTTWNDLVHRFATGGPLLAYAASGLNREQETTRTGPGAWSIAEVVIHVLDSDLVGGDRIKRVLAENEPTLLDYDQDAWASRLHYQELPVEEAINLFVANRQWLTHLLRRCAESDFQRVGHHSKDGRLTLAQLVARYVHHVDHHLRFLYAKRGNVGASIYPRYSESQD